MFNPGPLSLLHFLTIDIDEGVVAGGPNESSSSPPFFSGAVDLKAFCFHSKAEWPSFLLSIHFAFPNLVSLVFSTAQLAGFHASQLLDFLEGSPTLQTEHINIIAGILFEGVPRERIMVLPNVEKSNLAISDGRPGY